MAWFFLTTWSILGLIKSFRVSVTFVSFVEKFSLDYDTDKNVEPSHANFFSKKSLSDIAQK